MIGITEFSLSRKVVNFFLSSNLTHLSGIFLASWQRLQGKQGFTFCASSLHLFHSLIFPFPECSLHFSVPLRASQNHHGYDALSFPSAEPAALFFLPPHSVVSPLSPSLSDYSCFASLLYLFLLLFTYFPEQMNLGDFAEENSYIFQWIGEEHITSWRPSSRQIGKLKPILEPVWDLDYLFSEKMENHKKGQRNAYSFQPLTCCLAGGIIL